MPAQRPQIDTRDWPQSTTAGRLAFDLNRGRRKTITPAQRDNLLAAAAEVDRNRRHGADDLGQAIARRHAKALKRARAAALSERQL